MHKVLNAVWSFFASVKLALITLFILAAASTVGTVIEQGKEHAYYVQKYGPNLTQFFEVLDITNTYKSWWYMALLGLFAANLVVCSIERLPRVWRLVVMDNLSVDPQKLEKMSFTHRADTKLSAGAAAEQMHQFLIRTGWKRPRRLDRPDSSILFFSQKGAWTRLGVYIVHLSFLIILIGAMIGKYSGLEAYVFLPEGKEGSSNVFLRKTQQPVPLGFKLQNDHFEKTFYPKGMIKQFHADLTVLDPEEEKPYKKSIVVNDPLTYKGFTFYMGDTYPLDDFSLIISNRTTGMKQTFRRIPTGRDVVWEGTGASFRIEEVKRDQDGAVQQVKIRFTADANATPSIFWMKDNTPVTIKQSGKEFTISFHQLYSILLLVKKDPGVSVVYFGCIMMVVGIAISFFLSHKRVWLQITTRAKDSGSLILVSGTSNKNKQAFERGFQELVNRLGDDAEV